MAFGGAISIDSLRAQPVPTRLVLPKVSGRCLEGPGDSSVRSRLATGFGVSRQIRMDSLGSGLLRIKIDTADSLCDLTFDFQDSIGQASARVTLAVGQLVAGSDALERAAQKLSTSLARDRTTSLEIRTTPPGARVLLNGMEAGKAPLRLDGLRSGAVSMWLLEPGWNTVTENLRLLPGQPLVVERVLTRTKAWLDSVRLARIAGHRDSVWKAAQSRPAKDLNELFDRLAGPVPPGIRLPVAIIPFDVTGQKSSEYDPGVMAAEYGVARWTNDSRFVMVERQGVNKLLKEQAFAQSGSVSDSGAAQLGKIMAVRYLVTGTVKVIGGKQTFSARLVSVETGEILSAAVSESGTENLEELYRDALGERGQLSAALYRSTVGPGWGQFYTGHPVHGAIALGGVALAAGWTVWSAVDYLNKDAQLQQFRNHDPATKVAGGTGEDWIARAEGAREVRNQAGTTLAISLGVLGVVWVANVIDAGVLGYQESQRIQAKYFAYLPTPVSVPQGMALAWRF